MKTILLLCGLLLTSAFVGTEGAHASFRKSYIGSECSFTDGSLTGYGRAFHLFANTSGAGQWITCPLDRSGSGSLSFAGLYATGSALTGVRLEMRAGVNSLAGWNSVGTTALAGGTEYNWGAMSMSGDAALAISAFLPNGASITSYILGEN